MINIQYLNSTDLTATSNKGGWLSDSAATNLTTLLSKSFVETTTLDTFKSTLSKVATSGSYNDLTDKPAVATTTADGLMSKEDKTKLDEYEARIKAVEDAIAGANTAADTLLNTSL